MVARTTTVGRKGQVTIPIEIRRALGLKEGDRVAVEQDGDRVLLRRSGSVTERTAGMLAKYNLPYPLTAEEEREAAEMAIAEEVWESMNRP